MPLDVVGEHAKEDMGSHTVRGPMADGADIEVDGLQAAESALDPREIFVGLDRFFGIELFGRHGRPDHIDAVEAGFLFDLFGPSLDGEMAIANLNGEVLADLAIVDDCANCHADRRRSAQWRVLTPDLRLDAGQIALGRGQQRLALALRSAASSRLRQTISRSSGNISGALISARAHRTAIVATALSRWPALEWLVRAGK